MAQCAHRANNAGDYTWHEFTKAGWHFPAKALFLPQGNSYLEIFADIRITVYSLHHTLNAGVDYGLRTLKIGVCNPHGQHVWSVM